MENYLIRSKTYLEKARKNTLERRAAICNILSENPNLGYEAIHALLLRKGFKAGLTTVENDLFTFKAAENYLSGKISRKELEEAAVPYRQKIYRDVLCLIQDGITPEVSEEKSAEESILVVAETESQKKTPNSESKVGNILRKGQDFLQDVGILFSENQNLANQLSFEKFQLEEERTQRGRTLKILERVKKRLTILSRKANDNNLFRAVTRLGYEKTVLQKENNELKQQQQLFEERNILLEKENASFKKEFSLLKEKFEFQELELLELQEWHDKLLNGFSDCEEGERSADVDRQDFIALSCPTEINGKQYFFPTYCASLNMSIELGDKFLETFCELSEEMRNRTVKAMKLLAKNGPAYPSLNNKKREVDGFFQIYVNKKYRIFWGIEKHTIIFYGVAHKNAL